MKLSQLQKQRAAAKRTKVKEQRLRRKLRETERKQKRKAKREARARPRNRLATWGARIRDCGVCAVCGIGVHPKMKDGKPVIGKKSGRPVIIPLHAHHLLPKEKYPEFKFKKINGICLCPEHHKYGRYSAHRNPIWFAWWLHEHCKAQYLWCLHNMGKLRYEIPARVPRN